MRWIPVAICLAPACLQDNPAWETPSPNPTVGATGPNASSGGPTTSVSGSANETSPTSSSIGAASTERGSVDIGSIGTSGTTDSATATNTTGVAASTTDSAGTDATSGAGTTESTGSTLMVDRYRNAVFVDEPVAYWPLDETSGPTATDLTGNGFDGTYLAGVSLGDTGAFADGSSLAPRFNGSNWVDMGDILGFPDRAPFSVECWAAADTLGGLDRAIVAKSTLTTQHQGLRLSHIGNTMTLAREPGGWVGDTSAMAAGQYSHVVGTYDGFSLVVYVDGVQVVGGVDSTSMPSHAGTFRIGAAESFDFFRGKIDEVAIYDYALSQLQIQAHIAAADG